MRTHIRALKEELQTKESLLDQITELSTNVNQVDESYEFSPKPGRLFDLLKLLRDNQINYSTNFDIDDEIGKSGTTL